MLRESNFLPGPGFGVVIGNMFWNGRDLCMSGRWKYSKCVVGTNNNVTGVRGFSSLLGFIYGWLWSATSRSAKRPGWLKVTPHCNGV
eukprot:1142831-Pelagomonas_calceolata.AAC.1